MHKKTFCAFSWLRLLNTKKSGKLSYRVLIRIAKNGKLVHMVSETFDSKTIAKAWAKKRETELSAQKVFKQKEKPLKTSKVIQDYISQFGHSYGRSKNYDLARLLRYPIANSTYQRSRPKY